MSTRGNVVFLENELENMNQLTQNSFENYPTIYIHSDMYPEGALPRITEFLNIKGAKYRCCDASYIGAWFVGFIVNKNTNYVQGKDEEKAEDAALRHIKEIRKTLTRGKQRLTEKLKKENKSQYYSFEIQKTLNFDINRFMKELNDFIGIGLQTGLNPWCDYTYVIVPQNLKNHYYDENIKIRIYMYDAELSLIGIHEV